MILKVECLLYVLLFQFNTVCLLYFYCGVARLSLKMINVPTIYKCLIIINYSSTYLFIATKPAMYSIVFRTRRKDSHTYV